MTRATELRARVANCPNAGTRMALSSEEVRSLLAAALLVRA